ncbi:MAG: hypothetical protein IBJ10_06460 [Phycisphaerales bacterium]|nr:hypothetical protein [Phycisphaerales bacterium]
MQIKRALFALPMSLCAAAASAGITSMEWSPVTIGALDLAPDGVWSQGDDYLFREYDVVMNENWRSGFGRNVVFGIGYEHDGDRATGINFTKSVSNNTSYFWSSFRIVLTPGLGSSMANVMASANPQFSDVNVSAGPGSSWVILWSQNGGTGVGIGDNASLSFSFDIDGNLGFMMKQTPIPAPGAAAVLGLAGLAGARRRRAA